LNTLRALILPLLLLISLGNTLSEPIAVSINPIYQGIIDLSRTGLKNPNKFIVDGAFIYIVDQSEAIYKCDLEGDIITKVAQVGTDRLYPTALAKDFQYLYVLDRLRGIVKFSLENDFNQFYWISPNIQNAEIYEPRALAIDNNKDLYIADAGQNNIIKTNALGLREWTQGRFGNGPTALQDPVAIGLDSSSQIYIVDQQLSRVQIYAQDQTLLYTLAEFNEPTDLAITLGQPNTLYICDRGNRSIEIFQNGKHLQTLAINGIPQAIALTTKYLYVLDAQTKRMYVYAL